MNLDVPREMPFGAVPRCGSIARPRVFCCPAKRPVYTHLACFKIFESTALSGTLGLLEPSQLTCGHLQALEGDFFSMKKPLAIHESVSRRMENAVAGAELRTPLTLPAIKEICWSRGLSSDSWLGTGIDLARP